tara:strand:+ start:344 stop:1612 length:1269 start_codon:yes stop_codon:yes gene_type:complete
MTDISSNITCIIGEMDLSKLTKKELLDKCEEVGFKKCKSKNKSELINLLQTKMVNSKKIELIFEEDVEDINEPIITPVTQNYNLLDILKSLFTKYSLIELAKELNVATGTITRWIELNDIPKNYEFDILKLSNIQINYSNYSTKEKDQFFTPVETAAKCFQIFTDVIKTYGEKPTDFKYIEPSAGDGRFLQVLPSDTIALDIEPRHPSIINADYLNWYPSKNNNFVVFGNPPFGLRGHTALKFINHSLNFANYVCFILPQLFESDGKGVPRKRVKGYNLIHSTKLLSDFYEPCGNRIKINTIFQIWSKNHNNNLYNIIDYTNDKMKIYSMSDGGTISSTRNKDMIGKCDIYIPSTCFGKENMKCYMNFEDLPGKKGYGILFTHDKTNMITKMLNIEWDKIAFLSTNSAYNLRSSQIYSLFNL